MDGSVFLFGYMSSWGANKKCWIHQPPRSLGPEKWCFGEMILSPFGAIVNFQVAKLLKFQGVMRQFLGYFLPGSKIYPTKGIFDGGH